MPLPFHVLVGKLLSAQKGAMAPYLAEESLSPGQPKILRYLTDHGPCKQKEIADFYVIEPATVSRILEHMHKQGLVLREHDQKDKRAAVVQISEKGKAVWKKMQTHFAKLEECELAGFSNQERQQFREYIARMYENLTKKKLEDE